MMLEHEECFPQILELCMCSHEHSPSVLVKTFESLSIKRIVVLPPLHQCSALRSLQQCHDVLLEQLASLRIEMIILRDSLEPVRRSLQFLLQLLIIRDRK